MTSQQCSCCYHFRIWLRDRKSYGYNGTMPTFQQKTPWWNLWLFVKNIIGIANEYKQCSVSRLLKGNKVLSIDWFLQSVFKSHKHKKKGKSNEHSPVISRDKKGTTTRAPRTTLPRYISSPTHGDKMECSTLAPRVTHPPSTNNKHNDQGKRGWRLTPPWLF